jgi:CHAD domain-containing protein
MNDVIRDIDVLKNAIIALCEGASDEKRMALNSLARLIEEKEKIVEEFEKEFADDSSKAIA